MIPKIIHYCWFGGKPLPDLAQKCIDSWKKYCPDYEIIRWDESNYDLHKNHFVENAYKNKKWAFLTDYVRLDVVYQMGGIYLDTDVELVKSLEPLLETHCYMGMEKAGRVNTGLGFGAEKNHPFIFENKRIYEVKNYYDKHGRFVPPICVDVTTNLMIDYGLKRVNTIQEVNGVVLFPIEFFCPQDMETGVVVITSNTYSIHYYSALWKSDFDMVVYRIGKVIKRIVGENIYKKIALIKHKLMG